MKFVMCFYFKFYLLGLGPFTAWKKMFSNLKQYLLTEYALSSKVKHITHQACQKIHLKVQLWLFGSRWIPAIWSTNIEMLVNFHHVCFVHNILSLYHLP